MDQNYSRQGSHRLVINNREDTDITGVMHVDSFDDEEVVLETEKGLLAIRGEDLHIKQLNLEKGELTIEGLVLEVVYSDEKQLRDRGKNIFERIFR